MQTDTRKIHNPIGFSIIINVIALLTALFIYKPFFEEIDDANIAMIAEGVFGSREPHLIYSNIILGYIYKGLYSLCPSVRWLSVLQYMFMFLSLTAITYIIQRMSREGRGRMPAAVLILSLAYEVYVSLQYTKTSVIVCVAGYICLLYTFYGECREAEEDAAEKIILRIFAFVLLIYGILLRDDAFLLATLLMLPVGIYEFIVQLKKKDRDARRVGSFVGLFASVGCLFLLTAGINMAVYALDPAWKSFIEYNETRTDLIDYRYDLLDYNKYSDRLGSLGISENDALMYLTWQFGDDSVFDVGKMREVLKDAPVRWTMVSCLKALAQHIYEDVMLLDPLVLGLLFLVLSALAAVLKSSDKGRLAALISQLAVFAGILVFYELSGRWSHRIVFAAMIIVAVSAVWLRQGTVFYTDTDAGKDAEEGADEASGDVAGAGYERMVYAYASAFIIAGCITVLMGNRLDYNRHAREIPDYGSFFESIENDKDTLYIADTFTFQYAHKYEVFKPYREGSLSNIVAVGTWYVNSPVTRKITSGFGYSNPVRALAGVKDAAYDNGRVILVDNMYYEEKIEYLKEHYANDFDESEIRPAGEIAGLCVYECGLSTEQ